ncbi:MAG TPA: arylesterase [Pyrinomonadaceae bacterium]|jgi:acyl-CoA thioesterase-1
MRAYLFTLLFVLMMLTLASCAGQGQRNAPSATAQSPTPAASPAQSLPKIVAFGDSLTAGLGLKESESYPSLLQKRLDDEGYKYEVVNAGVSGDTSAGGVRRLDWALEGDVRFLILELGANDLLRGQPVGEMKKNLSEMIERAQQRGVKVLLAGMYAPTNTGADYQREVQAAFQTLAREHNVTLIPFFLDRVAGIETLNQSDGIHPNAEGTKIVAATVYESLRPLLEKERSAESGAPAK